MTMHEVPSNCLLAPEVTAEDFFNVLSSARPSVSSEDLEIHEAFAELLGTYSCGLTERSGLPINPW
jgi:hypothetical protein